MVKERPVNAMSVDVEDYFHVSAFRHVVRRQDWDSLPARVEQNTDKLLEIFDGHSIRATFFILGWVAERFPNLVRRITDGGHEIACHGQNHSLIYEQHPRTFVEETLRAKTVLEDQAQRAVIGYRAASWSVTSRSLWALDKLHELGFKYDSSIFPVQRDLYGIPESSREVHERQTKSGPLIEFPPATTPLMNRNIPMAGGGYFRLYPYWLTRAGLRRINQIGARSFIFYIHPWEIDPEQPRLRASVKSRVRHYLNLKRCERRLRHLIEDFRFDTAESVLAKLGVLDLHGETSMVTSYDAVAREQHEAVGKSGNWPKQSDHLQTRERFR